MAHRFLKTISAVTCAIISMQSVGFAVLQREKEFSDLQNHWAKSVIMRLNDCGIMSGYDNGTIRPDSYVSAAEFITMTVKSLGYTEKSEGGYWAQPYIDKAVELGLIANGEITDYAAPITRSQMARIAANALKDNSVGDENAVKSKINDYALIGEEYKPYVVLAYDKKIVNGKDFQKKENGAVLMKEETRRSILTEWQKKKKEIITHPYLNEKVEWGMVPYVQCMLLARFLRGDLDGYPAFLWK